MPDATGNLADASNADPDMPADAPWYARYLSAKFRCISREIRFWLAAVTAVAPTAYEYLPKIQSYLPPPVFHICVSGLGIFTAIGIARNFMKEPK